MRKRDRENPCEICGHYHKYEEGEVCETCGHRFDITAAFAAVHVSTFPSEILSRFIYLGTYDNASHVELLKTQGITHILNAVPTCQSLYRNTFIYYSIQDDQKLPFDDAIQFLEQCEREKARVLVHCMSGKSRSPAIVIAYLMKIKGWKLEQSHRWVKDRRPSIELSQVVYEQLQEYEQKIFGSNDSSSTIMPSTQSSYLPFFNADLSKPNNPPVPAFNNSGPSIFSQAPIQNFTFGAGAQRFTITSTLSTNNVISAVNDACMEDS